MTTTQKITRRTVPKSAYLQAEYSPLMARILSARGITNGDDLKSTLDALHAISELSNINKAVALLVEAIKQDKRILIVGDYDADGATSTALGIRALKSMGAKHVAYLVPNRFEYGYGLTPEIVEVAKQTSPDLLITVDNGISSIAGVASARDAGIKVLVTDHHLPGADLPVADAIVNPNCANDLFPSKCIAGVGVIFYVMLALRSALRENGWFEQQNIAEPNMGQFLDLVALGTVADVVKLDKNNRILVEQGLRRIRSGQCCAGISALLKIGKRNQTNTVASDLGFAIGPRLNAAGRLDDMSLGIECLLTDDVQKAQRLALTLDKMNNERRLIEQDMKEQALLELANKIANLDNAQLPAGLCFCDEAWHQGVIGILASRIKDKVHRPVIVFAKDNNGFLKGSARSVQGFHIKDALEHIAALHPSLMKSFGGHAMAAGLTLSQEQFALFKTAFAEEAAQQLGEDVGQAVIMTDGELSTGEMTLSTAEELRYALPWGQGFPEPVFDGEFEVLSYKVIGADQTHLKLKLRHSESEQEIESIAFGQAEAFSSHAGDKVHMVYRLDVNEYNGSRKLQLNAQSINPL